MNIEILGAGFKNKGAHLMLIAAVQEITRIFPDARIAVRSKPDMDWEGGGLGLYQKPRESESFFGNLKSRMLFNQRSRDKLRMLLDSEIDVVLDASGYKYSDRFGHRSIANRAKTVTKWKREGKKVVLLPQAFGPFKAPRVKKAVQVLADQVDLLFPRDQESYNYVMDLVGARDNIRMFPDFTNLVEGKRPEYFTPVKPRACLIPNAQMIERTTGDTGESYIPFVARCARFLHEAGLEPFILLHEMEKDGPLALEIKKSAAIPLEIIEEEDPVYVKGIIGACYLVVGSRFHALISALSQGIPAVATSWSHKYERLYEEWGCPELLISDLDFDANAQDILRVLTDREKHDGIAERLGNSREAMRQKTRQMWGEVVELITA